MLLNIPCYHVLLQKYPMGVTGIITMPNICTHQVEHPVPNNLAWKRWSLSCIVTVTPCPLFASHWWSSLSLTIDHCWIHLLSLLTLVSHCSFNQSDFRTNKCVTTATDTFLNHIRLLPGPYYIFRLSLMVVGSKLQEALGSKHKNLSQIIIVKLGKNEENVSIFFAQCK